MKYEPWKIIEESFRKHMVTDDDKNDPHSHADSPEGYLENQIQHNLEYFKWHIDKNTGDVVFNFHATCPPLGLFYGREVAIPLIHKDLTDYVALCRSYLILKIAEAVGELQKQRIPAGEIQIPKNWCALLSPNVFGLPVAGNNVPRVLSEASYGRFVLIEGLA